MFDSLFSPITIRGTTFKNRVKMPGAATCLNDGQFITDRMIAYHVARAKGGCGLNTVSAVSMHVDTAPDSLVSIAEDKFMPMFAKLCDAVHAAGGKVNVQLDQGGISTFYVQPEITPFIPSDRPEFGIEGASLETMAAVRDGFADSAARAVKCGVDAIEMHLGHGYGLHGFLSGSQNKRTDEYGGSAENRARYPLECIRAVRAAIPEEMPIFLRIAPFDDLVEDGLTLEDTIQFAKWAYEAGADALDVTRGNCWGHAAQYMIPPMDLPRGFNVPNAAKLKAANTGMVVVGVGRINDPAQADGYIADGLVDMVDIGRAQMADPEFCNKAQAGKVEDIVRCIGCLEGCFDRCHNPDYPEGTSCLWNPALGKEEEYAITPVAEPKKVLVVGGGVAGMELTMTMNARGHKVVLAEQDDKLGGIFRLAGVAPRKEETLEAVEARAGQVMRCGAEVRLNTRADAALIDEVAPDAVVFATGGSPVTLPIPGADKAKVIGYKDILSGKVAKPTGKVVVIGGGLVGCEVAEYIHTEGTEVTIVEMGKEIAGDAGATRNQFIVEIIEEEGIEVICKAKAAEITDTSLIIEKRKGSEEIECDYVVMAVGSTPIPQDELVAYCEGKGIATYIVGDAKEVGFAIDAIADAAAVARQI